MEVIAASANKLAYLFCLACCNVITASTQGGDEMIKKWHSTLLATFLAFALIVFPQTAFAENDVYVVKPGDTLWEISQKANVSLNHLLQVNNHLLNQDILYPYELIFIPSSLPTDIDQPESPAPHEPAEPVPTPQQPTDDVSARDAWEQEVLDLVNVERSQAGLSPLQMDVDLAAVARDKSKDMRDYGYFSHTSPTYGSPFDMMTQYGIQYRAAGENIAAGQKSPTEVMQAWMDSPGHRENIMNADYTHLGVGLVEGGSYGYYWTQMFISK